MAFNKNLYAVILAGGAGTRFWPVSRKSKPKQFLNITGKGTLFQETIRRISQRIVNENIFVVTNENYRREVARQVAGINIPKSNILLEPEGRNTAPAICWAAARINKINKEAVMMVLPSDHLILNQNRFLKVLDGAVRLALDQYLVTLGIVPTRPDTGYGYLKTVKSRVNNKNIVKVEKFTEKPSAGRARQFLKKKNYLWNSGMFIWKSSVILQEFRRYLPDIYNLLVGAGIKPVVTNQGYVKKIWALMPNISIDYGILEKAANVATIPARDIGWSDLGSWESLMDVLPKDKNGNITKGDVVQMYCKDTLIWGGKKLIASIGVNNLVIIDTPDALLICRKDMSQQVKEITTWLGKEKRDEI